MQVRPTTTGFKGLLGFFVCVCCCSRVTPHLYAISSQIKLAKVNMHFKVVVNFHRNECFFLTIYLLGQSQGKHEVQLTTSPSGVNSCSTIVRFARFHSKYGAMKKKMLP